MTNCQQNKHGLDRQEMYPPFFLVARLLSGVKSTLFLPLLSGQLTRVRFTMVNWKCRAVNHGKLEFTMVNFLQCDLNQCRRSLTMHSFGSFFYYVKKTLWGNTFKAPTSAHFCLTWESSKYRRSINQNGSWNLRELAHIQLDSTERREIAWIWYPHRL